jgi:hypothetical protein
MTTFLLRPNGLITNNGMSNGAGTGTADVRLGDNSDANTMTAVAGNSILLDLQTFTIPAGHYVQSAIAYERVKSVGDAPSRSFLVKKADGSFPLLIAGPSFDGETTSFATHASGLNMWAGLTYNDFVTYPLLTQAQVDTLQLEYIVQTYGGSATLEIADLWIEVYTNSVPVPVVTAPSGTVTSGSRPPITVQHVDAESDPMDYYQLKIFSSAQYGAGGFDPETSTATWDSGVVALSVNAGNTFQVTPGVDLANGITYKAYVKVRQAVDGMWSNNGPGAWRLGSAFTVVLDAPAQATITAAADDANARITVTAQGRDNELTKNQADIETDTTGWAAGANTTISRITSTAAHGSASLQLRSVAAGATSATTPTGLSGIPVVGSKQYTAIANIRRISATANRNGRIDIAWYTAAGALISTSTGSSVADNNTDWVAQTVCTATSPSNAAFATIILNVLTPTAANEDHAFDQISFAPGASTTWTRGGFVTSTQVIFVERSVDAGVTWTAVRNGTVIDPGTGQQVIVQDYEAPPGTSTQYRARSVSYENGISNPLVGPNSATASATSTPTTSTGWWLKDPQDSTRNMVIDVYSETWNTEEDEEMAVYKPLGRTYPVVVSDVIHGRDGRLELEFTSLASITAFRLLRSGQRPLLLQRVYAGLNEQKYIRLGRKLSVKESNTNPILYQASIDYVEVDVP